MKLLSVLAVLCLMTTANATVLVCKSDDFKPSEYEGQALKLTLAKDKTLTKVEKVEGSWFGDSGEVNAPKILAKNSKATVYEVNFDHDDYNGRVIVPNAQKISTVTYSFSYADDESYITSTSLLRCNN